MFLLTENLTLMAFRDLEVFNTVPWPLKFGDRKCRHGWRRHQGMREKIGTMWWLLLSCFLSLHFIILVCSCFFLWVLNFFTFCTFIPNEIHDSSPFFNFWQSFLILFFLWKASKHRAAVKSLLFFSTNKMRPTGVKSWNCLPREVVRSTCFFSSKGAKQLRHFKKRHDKLN